MKVGDRRSTTIEAPRRAGCIVNSCGKLPIVALVPKVATKREQLIEPDPAYGRNFQRGGSLFQGIAAELSWEHFIAAPVGNLVDSRLLTSCFHTKPARSNFLEALLTPQTIQGERQLPASNGA